jgi:hypothetical protein
MTAFDKIPPQLMGYARSMQDLGIKDLAWPAEHIDEVLRSLETAGVAILGGDVYEERDRRLHATFDNWYCERQSRESFADYVRRCWEHTRQYILAYPKEPKRSLYFVLVLSDELTAGL